MTVSKHENAAMIVKSANKNATTMPVNDQKMFSTAVNNKNYNAVSVSDQPSNAVTIINDEYDCSESTGPYIPISECITGVRAQVIFFLFKFYLYLLYIFLHFSYINFLLGYPEGFYI